VRGLLFEGLDVSSRRGKRRPWVAAVSFGLHAAAFTAVVLLPLFFSGDAPVVVWAAPIPDYVPDPPRVTLPPKPRPVRPQTSAQRTTSAPELQSIAAPVIEPDQLPTTDAPPVAADAPMILGGGCPECAPGTPGTPIGDGDAGAGSAEDAGGPVLVGGDIQAPRKVKHVAPVYPPLALQIHLSGMVIVECVIDRDGNVTSARVLRGHPLLDAAALRAVEQWAYEPTRLNGQPVAVQMTVTVRFNVGRS
jgi:periplasmic protein TonB